MTILIATDSSGIEHQYERTSKNTSSSKNIEKMLLLKDCGFTYNTSSLDLINKIKSTGGWDKYLRDKKRYDKLTQSEVFRRDIKVYRKSKRKVEILESKYSREQFKYLNLSETQKASIIKTIRQKDSLLNFRR